jgi:hypothetical protein
MVTTLKVAVFDGLAAALWQSLMIRSFPPETIKLIKSFCRYFTGHVSRFLEKSPPMLHGAEGKKG